MPFCTQCGEKVEEGQKVCSRCGESLVPDKEEKSLDKFFAVPIDYSEVREAIPVGEDINYSCLFAVNTHGMAPPFHEKIQTFQSHVLFTENGIAFQEPKGGVLKSFYRPLHKIDQISVGTMGFTEGVKVYTFIIVPTTDYVSSQDLDMWMWRFMFKFMPRIIDEKKKHKYTKGLKRLEKMYNKIKKGLGEEECEFFRTNVDYEEFKKHQSIASKAMVEAGPKWAQSIARKYIKEL